MKTTPDEFPEVIADIDYRIEQTWLKIRREAAVRQAKRERSEAAAVDFREISGTSAAIVDHIWSYVLDICRSRQIRPADLVPQAATSLRYLCRALVDYGRERQEAGGDARQIKTAANRAAHTIQKHIEVTAREAMLGYAGGRPVFPRADWPDSWIKASTRKALAAGLFLLGMLAGGVVTKAFGTLLP